VCDFRDSGKTCKAPEPGEYFASGEKRERRETPPCAKRRIALNGISTAVDYAVPHYIASAHARAAKIVPTSGMSLAIAKNVPTSGIIPAIARNVPIRARTNVRTRI